MNPPLTLGEFHAFVKNYVNDNFITVPDAARYMKVGSERLADYLRFGGKPGIKLLSFFKAEFQMVPAMYFVQLPGDTAPMLPPEPNEYSLTLQEMRRILKEKCEQSGKTMEEYSTILGFTPSYISVLLNSQRPVPVALAERIGYTRSLKADYGEYKYAPIHPIHSRQHEGVSDT